MLKFLTFIILAILPGVTGIAGTGEGELDTSEILFGDRIGLSVHFNQGETLDHLANLSDLGVKWVRDSPKWSQVESVPGQYAFPDDFKTRLAYYKENDMGISYGMWYGNGNLEDPYDPVAYGRYAAALVPMLNESGVDYLLELWNEPHNFGLGPHFGGSPVAKPPSPWVDRYLEMVDEAVKQAKAVDPKVKLLINEDVWVAHYWFIEHGVPRQLDGVALHPYVHGRSAGPEEINFGPDVEWAQPFTIVDEDRSFASAVRRVRQQYGNVLDDDPEIWVTEWGYRIGDPLAPEGPMTESLAAAYLPRMYIIAAAQNIRGTFWHNLQDLNDGPYGLLRNDGEPREAYTSFKTMTQELANYKLIKSLSGASHPTEGLHAYLFEGEMDWKIAVWNIEGESWIEIETTATTPLEAVNHLGDFVQINYLRNGTPVIRLDIGPVYITSGIDSETRLRLVPEPTSLTLLSSGSLLFISRRKRIA